MYLTGRALLWLLLVAPFWAAGLWLPGLRWLGLGYGVLYLLVLALDWRAAGRASRFELRREHDSKLSLGADNPITVHLRNPFTRPVTFWLRDEPPDEFQIDHRILSGQVGPRATWQATYHLHPLRRGDYSFGNLNLRWVGPLGLVVRQGRVAAGEGVKVYPNLLDVRRYDLLLKQNRLQEIGLRNARVLGQGHEFERLREYLPDDEYRRINWKATARRNRPITVQYQTERSQNIMALIDTGRMMQSPVANMAKLDYVVNAVLLLGYVATGMGDKVGVMTFADQVDHFLSPRQGRGQFYGMLELLYGVAAQPVEPDYRRAFSYLALNQRKRALVVIFTDLSGGATMQSLVSHVTMLAKHSLPLVVTISDPDIHAAAVSRPGDSLTAYQRAAAMQYLDERQIILNALQRQGILTLDVPANQLSISVIKRYLELKERMKL